MRICSDRKFRRWKASGNISIVTQRQIEACEESGQVLGCPLFTLGSEICTQDEWLPSLVQEILSGVARYFEDAIREAQASGRVEGRNAVLKARLPWGFLRRDFDPRTDRE